MKTMVIRVTIDGEDIFFLPLDQEISWWVKNDGDADCTKMEIESPIDNQEKLKLLEFYLNNHTTLQYGYNTAECAIDWVCIENPDDLVICDEFGLQIYAELAIEREWYKTPFSDTPTPFYFSCDTAEQCFRGELYSKGFNWFDCPECGRTICEQNPNNGWMVQYRFVGDERVCNKCYEKNSLENGMELGDDDSIPGLFGVTDDELESHGYKPNNKYNYYGLGMGRNTTYSDSARQELVDHLQKLTDDGVKWFIVYEDMAIGGLGGYISLWEYNNEH